MPVRRLVSLTCWPPRCFSGSLVDSGVPVDESVRVMPRHLLHVVAILTARRASVPVRVALWALVGRGAVYNERGGSRRAEARKSRMTERGSFPPQVSLLAPLHTQQATRHGRIISRLHRPMQHQVSDGGTCSAGDQPDVGPCLP